MEPAELVNEIAQEMYRKFPSVMEYETDSRDTWPARMQFLLDTICKLDANHLAALEAKDARIAELDNDLFKQYNYEQGEVAYEEQIAALKAMVQEKEREKCTLNDTHTSIGPYVEEA